MSRIILLGYHVAVLHFLNVTAILHYLQCCNIIITFLKWFVLYEYIWIWCRKSAVVFWYWKKQQLCMARCRNVASFRATASSEKESQAGKEVSPWLRVTPMSRHMRHVTMKLSLRFQKWHLHLLKSISNYALEIEDCELKIRIWIIR